MTERRQNQIRWALVIVGFLVSLVLLAPHGEMIVTEPERPEHLRLDPAYPVPAPRPRDEGLAILNRPFLVRMADTDHVKGQQREREALDRYQLILDDMSADRLPTVAVSGDQHLATVTVDGRPFLSVLPQDCPEYHARLDEAGQRKLEEQVALSWAQVIEDDLAVQTVKRNPAYLRVINYLSMVVFFVVCAAQLVVTWISKRFIKNPLWSVKLFLWVIYFTALTALHPSLDGLAHVLTRGALDPIFEFMLVCVGVGFFHQLTCLGIHRYLEEVGRLGSTESVRASLRRQTLEQAWTFVSRVAWTFLGLCVFLVSLGVDLGSFFAGAGLVGVAIGVMARDVFLDFFNGAYILAEDQFVVGDWIESNNDSGEVVAFSLRSTRIRRSDGGLATIPNSDLRRVRNHSNQFSTVDFRVTVAHGSDTDRAMALILEEIGNLAEEWGENLVGEPDPLGVQELNASGRVLRVKLKTVPLMQWKAQRKLNRLVSRRFDAEGIQLGGAVSVAEVRLASTSPLGTAGPG